LGVGAVQEESHDFLEDFLADVDGAVDAIARFGPIHLTDGNVPGQGRCGGVFSSIAELDFSRSPLKTTVTAMKGIAMPGRGAAGASRCRRTR
jgi:hypothetical protein